LAHKIVLAFIRASVEAIPTGKQNTFAAHNPPDFVMAVVRPHGQTNMVNAFVHPVKPTEQQSLVERSVWELDRYWGISQKISPRPNEETVAFVRTTTGKMANFSQDKEKQSLKEVLEAVELALTGSVEAS
jgi:hypothetical protein